MTTSKRQTVRQEWNPSMNVVMDQHTIWTPESNLLVSQNGVDIVALFLPFKDIGHRAFYLSSIVPYFCSNPGGKRLGPESD